MDIWTREITYKKVRGINVDFSTRKIILQNGRGKKVDFLTMVITSKKVCGNDMGFLTSEITLKKVRGNDVSFLTQEITSKKWKWRINSSKFGLRCIEVISTSNRCGLHLVCLLSSHILFHLFCLYFLRMHHNYFFRRGFEGLRAQFQEAATRCCFVKKVFCVTSWCWHFNRFPSFRQNDQNARAVVFRQRFIIPFKKQVNFQANT